jgi:hypothetical protein
LCSATDDAERFRYTRAEPMDSDQRRAQWWGRWVRRLALASLSRADGGTGSNASDAGSIFADVVVWQWHTTARTRFWIANRDDRVVRVVKPLDRTTLYGVRDNRRRA